MRSTWIRISLTVGRSSGWETAGPFPSGHQSLAVLAEKAGSSFSESPLPRGISQKAGETDWKKWQIWDCLHLGEHAHLQAPEQKAEPNDAIS